MERLRSEAGFSIIETLVASFVLIVASVGVLTLLDSGTRASASARQRSTAAAIAQQDQERLRALPPEQLITKDETRPLAYNSGQFSVRSQGKVVRDANGDTGCTTGAPDYVRVTSTVTWTGMATAAPVTISSLVDRPLAQDGTKSSILLQITDVDGNPVNGATVTPSPAIAGTPATTDADGCWSAAGLTPGTTYTISITKTGFVDISGNTPMTVNTGALVAGALFRKSLNFDQAGTVTAPVYTRINGNASDTTSGALTTSTGAAQTINITNASLPAGVRTFPSPVTNVKFFPFPSAYGAYAGTCTANKMASPPAGYGSGIVVRNGALTLKIFEPSIKVTVKRGASTLVSGARVFFTPKDAGCSAVYKGTTIAGGVLPDPGLPYGTYDICADTTSGTLRAGRLTSQANTNAAGNTATVTIANQSVSNPACP